MVQRFFETEIGPYYEKWEEQQHIDRELWNKAGELGLLCPAAPVEYDGSGVDRIYSQILMEEQARVGDSASGFSLHSDIVANYIVNFGNEEQKHHWLPKMASGETVTAIAMIISSMVLKFLSPMVTYATWWWSRCARVIPARVLRMCPC